MFFLDLCPEPFLDFTSVTARAFFSRQRVFLFSRTDIFEDTLKISDLPTEDGEEWVVLVLFNLIEFRLVKFGFDSLWNCSRFHVIILKHHFSTYFVFNFFSQLFNPLSCEFQQLSSLSSLFPLPFFF